MADTSTPTSTPTPTPASAPVATQVAAATAPLTTGGGAIRTPLANSKVTDQAQSPGFFQVRSMKDRRQERYLKAIYYGGPGVGKTTLAGSATNIERMKDVILLSAEGGDIVFDDNERILDPDNIDMLKVDRVAQLEKFYQFLQAHVSMRQRNDEAGLRKLQAMVFGKREDEIDRVRHYHTLIIDSLSDIEAMNLAAVMGLDDKGFEMGNADAADWGVYRKNNNTIQQLIRSFRNLEMNVILICGERYSQDEMKRMHYAPWMTGQLQTQIQSLVDFVGYMVISGDPSVPFRTRRLYIEPLSSGPKFYAKCRRASIKKQWYDNPSMEDIMSDFGYVNTTA